MTGDLIVESWSSSDARFYELEYGTQTGLPEETYLFFRKPVSLTIFGEYDEDITEEIIKIDKP